MCALIYDKSEEKRREEKRSVLSLQLLTLLLAALADYSSVRAEGRAGFSECTANNPLGAG